MSTNNDVPQFFGGASDFVNKEELATSGKAFCIELVDDTDTMYGAKWFISIRVAGDPAPRTITFTHGDPEKSKREQDFLQLSQHPEYLPLHACTLKKYNFEGKSGYRIAARKGGGPCPCTPGTPSILDENPFLPDYPDDEPVLVEKPAPAPVVNTLAGAPPSGKQMMQLGKLSAQLNRDIDFPSTFAEAQQLLTSLEQELARGTAPFVHHGGVSTSGVPMR